MKNAERGSRKVLWIVLGVILAALLIILFGFHIDKLEIKGNSRLTDDQVKQEIGYENAHGNSLILWLMNSRTDHSDNDLVRSIKVSLESPRKVQVTVVEQSLVGGVQAADGYSYFNDQGIIILKTSEAQDNVPLVTGPSLQKIEVGSKIETENDDQMADLIEIATLMNQYSVVVDTIETSSDTEYSAHVGDVTILLGQNLYMEEKISELANLMDQLKDLSGTLHLESYDASQSQIIFTRDDIPATDTEMETEAQTETATETVTEDSTSYEENYVDDGSGY